MASRVKVSESAEQRKLAQYLDQIGAVWLHVPNEGRRNAVTGRRLKAAGMKAGVPDVLLLSRPRDHLVRRAGQWWNGVAIELKVKGGQLTEPQRVWLTYLSACGWATKVCYGFDEAHAWLVSLGYP